VTGREHRTAPSVPEITATVRPRDRAAWRAWLDRRGATAKEIWLLLAKKHARREGALVYDEAVEEALCVGWIDGIAKRYDDDHEALRFTPRKKESKWSALNRRRVAKLLREGRMTEAGLALVRHAKATGAFDAERPTVDPARPPKDLVAALAAMPAARAYFDALTPGKRKLQILWIEDAKRPETRARRIAEVVRLSARGDRKFR
jgi:uncharacterized protein YdeI (YjbR/CyaY-like superfamily)